MDIFYRKKPAFSFFRIIPAVLLLLFSGIFFLRVPSAYANDRPASERLADYRSDGENDAAYPSADESAEKDRDEKVYVALYEMLPLIQSSTGIY